MSPSFNIDDIKVKGAANLISAFPQLASAILIERYALSPSQEAELRGWPPEVIEAVRRLLMGLEWDVVEDVLTNAYKGMLGDSYSYTIYHDAATGMVKPATLYNYLSLVFDFGTEMYRFVKCIRLDAAKRAVLLADDSIDSLRRVDAAFIHLLTEPTDEDEPDSGMAELYACTPIWASRAIRLIERLAAAAPNAPRIDVVASELREKDPATYLLLRMASYIPAPRAVECIHKLFGDWFKSSVVGGLLEWAGEIPVLNYAAIPRLRQAIKAVEKDDIAIGEGVQASWSDELGAIVDEGGSVYATWEGAATLLCGGFKGEVVAPERDPPFEPSRLERLGAILDLRGGQVRVITG